MIKHKNYSCSHYESECEKWEDFYQFIQSNLDYRHFIWRGQADSSWLLEPTLDRLLKKQGKKNNDKLISEHLKRFKYATRGRRGNNPPNLSTENDWWALGQHNGLATPLLDWTRSPYVAAYFAYLSGEVSKIENRAVFGISQSSIQKKSDSIQANDKNNPRPPIIEFIEPLSDENARLVNQNGLFTRSPAGVDMESWMKSNFKDEKDDILIWKILLPDSERETALRSLNRMNINHLSLFPDLYGASKFVNIDLEIKKY